jgi:hypothetical protein
VPNSGKADFELLGVHGALPWLLCSKLPRQTLIVSQVSRLIWCVDIFRLFGCGVSISNVAASVFIRKRMLTRA